MEEGGPMERGILVSNPRNIAANASVAEKDLEIRQLEMMQDAVNL